MFRRVFFTSLAVVFLALTAPSAAQAQSIFLSGGVASLSTFDLDGVEFDVDTGWMTAGGLLFDIGTGGLWAGIEGSYGRSNAPDQDGVSDATVKPWGAMGFLGYSFPTPGSVDPYVFGGAGISGVKISGTEDGEEFDESVSEFGYEFGGGITFGSEASKIRPYLEGRYMSGGGEAESDFAGVPGVDVDAKTISALFGIVINVGS